MSLRRILLCSVLSLIGLLPTLADVRMPMIFGDHMVLQQDSKLPVWGWAAPGEKVTVTLGGQTATTAAATDGTWHVDLPASPVSGTAQTLTVAGTNTISYQDVLVGDVWLASGQSNMEYGIGNLAPDESTKASEPMLRLFCVPHATSLTPLKDLVAGPNDFIGKWVVCSPESLAKASNSGAGFSAVTYYFGREIQHATGHPVGLIGSYWGGTTAQAWTSLDGLQKDPILAHYVADHQTVLANYPQAQAALPKLTADYAAATKQWQDEVGTPHQRLVDAWNQAVATAHARGEQPPPGPPPLPRLQPVGPLPPDGGPNVPANLYNGLIAPLEPFALKGVIWYQGEGNAPAAKEYATLFPRLITDWREKWGRGDFPFLFVQLAAYGPPAQTPTDAISTDGNWPELRESQAKALSLPNTGMAVAIDIGDPHNIHPADKRDVGLRLALAAKHVAYGLDLVYSGPMYDSMKIDGNKVTLSFRNVAGGLKISAAPWYPAGLPVPAPTELTGFAVAGTDKNWVWAQAVIAGDKVIVTSEKVPSPVAVRYGWNQMPSVDLYNSENLPAVPFRTDDWN